MKTHDSIFTATLLGAMSLAVLFGTMNVQTALGQCGALAKPSICIVTNDSATGKNVIVWGKDTSMQVAGYKIYREGTATDQWDSIGYVANTDISQFVDSNSNPAIKPFSYRISTIDTCGNSSDTSDFHRTIHLTSNLNPNGNDVNLKWSHYQGFLFPTYFIYRGTSSGNIVAVDSLPGDSSYLSLTDIASGLGTGDSLYYFISLIPPSGTCSATKTKSYNSSKSNTSQSQSPTATPDANFTASKTAITPGDSVNFTDNSTNTITPNPGLAPLYSWTFSGGTPSTDTNKNPVNIKYNTIGCYDVKLVVTNRNTAGGSDSITKVCYINSTTSINEADQMQKLLVYPNPAGDVSFLRFTLNYPARVKAELFNVIGVRVTTITDRQFSSGSHEEKIDDATLQLRKGVYILRVNTGDESGSLRFVKM